MPVRRRTIDSGRSKFRKSQRPALGSYSPQPARCMKKRDPLQPWTRELVTTEYAQRMGYRINIQYKLRQRDEEKRSKGPGYYNININTFKTSIMPEGKAFTTSKRPVVAAKNTNPSPCTYGGDIFSASASSLIKERFTKTPHFEWSGFIDRFKPLVNETWKLPPNLYKPIDTGDVEALLKKRVSTKGPYELFTVRRDETSIKNHFGFSAAQGADMFYDRPSPLDLLLKHPTKRRCGVVYRKHTRIGKIQPELPGPGSYDIDWHTIKPSPPSKVPFLCSAKLKPVVTSSGPGPGRYFFVKKQKFQHPSAAKKKSSTTRRLSDIDIIVTDKKVSKILKKFAKSARRSAAKAKRKKSLEQASERSSRRSTLLRPDILLASVEDVRESRRLSKAPRLSVVQQIAIATPAAQPPSLDEIDSERRSSYIDEQRRLNTFAILGMIGENPEDTKPDLARRKSRVSESPIDRIDMVSRLSRVTVPSKKSRQRRFSQITSASQFSTLSSHSGGSHSGGSHSGGSHIGSGSGFVPPDITTESLQLGVHTFPDPRPSQAGKKMPMRLGISKTRTFGATEGDLDSLVEPNASQPILGPSLSKGYFGPSASNARIGPSASRVRLAKAPSKHSLTRSKTRLVSASMTRLGGSASKTRLGSASKTRLVSASKTRLGSASKTRLVSASKTRLESTSKVRIRRPRGHSKTRLRSASKSKTRMTSKTRLGASQSKSNLYEVKGSLSRTIQPISELKSALRVGPPRDYRKESAPLTPVPEELPAKQSLGQVSVSLSQAAALARARSKSESWNAMPKNVEEILYEHPFVLEAMVAGNPRDKFPLVLVVLREGCHAHEQDLVDFVNARVSKSQRLRTGLKIMSRLPERRKGVRRVAI